MFEVPVFDTTGKKLGAEKVDPAWFGGIVRRTLLHDAVVAYEANKRAGTAKAKGRGEVAGSKTKPWKQKHTGRARAGTKRSPIWRKGGVVFGPHPRDYSKDLPKRMKRLAVDSALLSKFKDGEAIVLDGLAYDKPRTAALAETLEKVGVKESCLLTTQQADDAGRRIWLSARNLPRVHTLPVSDLNAWDVLRYKRLCLTREAFNTLIASRRDGKAPPVPPSKDAPKDKRPARVAPRRGKPAVAKKEGK